MGRVALVTGGTRGLGRAISVALKDAGYTVVANYFGNVEAANQFNSETGIRTMRWDVSNYAESEAAIKKITEEVGPVEILVNNAGITRDTTLHRMTYQAWEEVLHTNLTSCFNLARLCIGTMREKGFGRIISVSSLNGQIGQFGQVNYSAAKAGVFGFTKALAQEGAARNVTVNAIAPGYCDTDMVRAVPADVLEKIVARIPVGRLGKPEDVARCVLFLAADDADFITGSTITVNGGQAMY